MNLSSRIFALLFLLFCMGACLPNNKSTATRAKSKKPWSSLDASFQPIQRLIHLEDKSYLYIAVPAREYTLSYKCYTSYPSGSVLKEEKRSLANQEPSKVQRIEILCDNPRYSIELRVETPDGRRWMSLEHINREGANKHTIYASKQGERNKPLLRNYIKKDEVLSFFHSDSSVKTLHLRYYTFAPSAGNYAPPPFSSSRPPVPLPETSSHSLSVEVGQPLRFEGEGMYFVEKEASSNKGTFFICGDSDYPNISRVRDLIEATRYISNNKEYEVLLASSNPKSALDDFWKNRHRDPEVAKRCLRLFYHRVWEANAMFSGQVEGWKTDRGLIYIVFGSPERQRIFADKETWYYRTGLQGQGNVEFEFSRKGELYFLRRNSAYRSVWGEQVQRWRRGQIR